MSSKPSVTKVLIASRLLTMRRTEYVRGRLAQSGFPRSSSKLLVCCSSASVNRAFEGVLMPGLLRKYLAIAVSISSASVYRAFEVVLMPGLSRKDLVIAFQFSSAGFMEKPHVIVAFR